jgi:hypothetical protein
VPYHTDYVIPESEKQAWAFEVRRFEAAARAGYDVREALAIVRDPAFKWPADLYPKVCAPARPSRM